MRELRVKTILDLAGNYGQQIASHDRATQKFLQGTQYSLGVATRAWGVFGAKLDSFGDSFWTRVAGAGGLALMARQVATFDESLTRIGINANVSAERMEGFKKQLFAIAERPDVNVKVDDLAAGMAAIVEKTGDLEFASKNMLNLGRFMQATGDSAEDIGELIGNIHTFGVDAPDDINKVVDAWLEMGKRSGMSLRAMINNGQQVLTLYQQLGRKGPDALREVGALMALATKQLGSPRRAAAASTEILEGLRQNLGMTVGLGLTDMSGHLKVPLDQALKKIIDVYKGNAPGLVKVFGQEGETLLTPLIDQYKTGKPMDALSQYLNVQADGTHVIEDAARAAQTAAESFNKLYDEWQKFGDSNLSKDLKGIASELNAINPATIQTVFKGLEYAGGGLLAIYGLRKAFTLGKDALSVGRYIFTGKRGGGLGGLMSGIGGATPVYVVNMPGGGMGGMGGAAVGETEGLLGNVVRPGLARSAWALARTPLGEIGELGAGAMGMAAGGVLAAGAAGYGIGTAIYDATDDTKFMDHVGSAVAHFVSLFSDDAKQAIDQRHAADKVIDQGKDSKVHIQLSWDANGNPAVKSVRKDTDKVNIDLSKLIYAAPMPAS